MSEARDRGRVAGGWLVHVGWGVGAASVLHDLNVRAQVIDAVPTQRLSSERGETDAMTEYPLY